jgi:uncharacterized protein YgfB (UPF0149 family)
MATTDQQYTDVIRECEDIFSKKQGIMEPPGVYSARFPSLIRSLSKRKGSAISRKKAQQKVENIGDDIRSEFIGIINYSIIGLIQLELSDDDAEELDPADATSRYHRFFLEAFELMQQKNHDYGEAWRSMSQESFVDLILMKLQRMRQILVNKGKTIISEGLDANYHDMINYSVFALIMMKEVKPTAA